MFRDVLSNVIERTEGAAGALIMGTDGIMVERVLMPHGSESNLDVAAAEFTTLVRNAQRTGGDIALGDLRELVLVYNGAHVVIRTLSNEYFLVLALQPDGNLGRGRFELRKAELELAREFVL